jgi:hypothetical protein
MMPGKQCRRAVVSVQGAAALAVMVLLVGTLAAQGNGGLRFISNDGQWDTPARFVARTGKLTLRLEPDAILLQLDDRSGTPGPGVLVRMAFEGASASAKLSGVDVLPGVFHYFLGNDPARWRRNVAGFAAVRYDDLFPGIGVRVGAHDQQPKYDIEVAPGARADWVVIRCEGIDRLSLDADGGLIMETALGPIRQAAPPTWRVLPSGERQLVACRYRLIDENRFTFDVQGGIAEQATLIDPELEWSTYLGGSENDGINGGMVMTPDGRTIMLGETASFDFPVTPGAFDTSFAGGQILGCKCDAYVTCLDSTGSSIVFSTFLGGLQNEEPVDIALGPSGDLWVTGSTSSPDFPTTPGAFDRTGSIFTDLFISRIAADGRDLVYSTLLGSGLAGGQTAISIVVDPQGEAVVFGSTGPGFPTTPGAYDTTHGGSNDAFATRINADGTGLVFSTFLGGADYEVACTGLIEPDGSVLVGGRGWMDIPTTPGTFQPVPPDGGGAFILRLSPDGSTVLTGTFLAGTKSDVPIAMALGPSDTIVVAGFTGSSDFPVTPGAFQTVYTAFFGPVGFVSCLNADLSELVFSTYLTCSRSAYIGDVYVDSAGTVTVAGTTDSSNFPTTAGAYSQIKKGLPDKEDVFVSRLSADGSKLYYSTFFGGTASDWGAFGGGITNARTRLGVSPLGTVTIAGLTESADLPITPSAYQTSLEGPSDAFVTRFDPLPAGVTQYGDSTPGCRGPIAIGVTAIPKFGSQEFAITSTNADSGGAYGLLALSLGSLDIPLPGAGTQVWVDPALLLSLLPITANAKGFAQIPLRIEGSPTLIGLTASAQCFWKDACGPTGWASSNALKFTVQP